MLFFGCASRGPKRPAMKLQVLTLTTVYPSLIEPAIGTFVRTRVEHMAALSDVKVLAPVPVINYGRGLTEFRRRVPRQYWEGAVEVIRPRWFYPPAAGAWNGFFLCLQVLWPLAVLRRRFPFQVVDAHFAHPEGVAAALGAMALGYPFTVTLRGVEHMHSQHWLRRRWMGWALRRAGRVITVSEKLRALALRLGVEPSRAVTIPNGIDTDVFHPRDRTASRAEYGVAAGRSLIVSAGHLIELKGHHRIIRAMRELADSGSDVELLIAGGRGRADDYEAEITREITALELGNRVRLLGHLDREALAKLMAAADLFCLASSREGWPNVVHEAMACGTPVVATNVGGVPEMIPSEQFGIIVPPDDASALAPALRRALSAQWRRDAIASWGRSRSWHQVAAEVIREMERVCVEFAER